MDQDGDGTVSEVEFKLILESSIQPPLTDNPAKQSRGAEHGDAYIDSAVSDVICPVSGLEMSGMYK